MPIKSLAYVFLLFPLLLNGQSLNWAIGSHVNTSIYDTFENTTVDAEGNFYKVGYYNGLIDLDPGPDVLILPDYSDEGTTCYIMKIDSIGELVWAKVLGSSWYSYGKSVEVDSDGNVYVWGAYKHELDADPGPDVYDMPNIGWDECFLLKLNSDGEFEWAKNFGGGLADYPVNMAFDSEGNMVITGVTETSIDCDPGPGFYYFPFLSSESGSDDFIIKLDSEGDFMWAGNLGKLTGSYPRLKEICMNLDGDVFITGTFSSTYDLDPTDGVYELSPTWAKETFILKISSAGEFQWVKSYIPSESMDNMSVHGLTASDAGYLYAVGEFSGEIDFDPFDETHLLTAVGETDAFITKINSFTGEMVWTKVLEGSNTDIAYDVIHDSDEVIYITGTTNSEAFDFDPGPGIENGVFNGDYDAFVNKLDASGNYIWGKLIGGPNTDKSRFVGLDEAHNIFLGGTYFGEVDFDFMASELILDEEELGKLFLLKINETCPISYSSIDAEACGEYIAPSGAVYTESGTYTDSVFSESGCDSVLTITLEVLSVDNTISQDGTTLTANLDGALYQWVDCANDFVPIDGETNQDFTAISGGSYAVIVSNGICTDTSICFDYVLSISENSAQNFSAYPNPTTGQLTIDFNQFQKNTTVKIYTLTGESLFVKEYSNSKKIELDFNAASGLYLLEISTEGSLINRIKIQHL